VNHRTTRQHRRGTCSCSQQEALLAQKLRDGCAAAAKLQRGMVKRNPNLLMSLWNGPKTDGLPKRKTSETQGEAA
jgi:hypothetical protein